ncbi:MAG: alpha-L-fucosidase 2 [Algoriphagus sp.]|jgi:alpha-L-fucosidase 2
MKFRLCFLMVICYSLTLKGQGSNEKVWFQFPGKYWNSQGLHLGNGYFGASFLGGVKEEIISITDASMWTGEPANGDWYRAGVNPKAKENLPLIREAVVNGNIPLADSLVINNFLGKSDIFGFFTSIGDLKIEFPNSKDSYSSYHRELDLSTSVGHINYKEAGTTYSREYFCSYPDKVLILKYSSNKKNSIDLNLGSKVIQKTSSVSINNDEFEISGKINGNDRPFRVLVKLKQNGGELGQSGNQLTLRGADDVVLYITMSTNYKMAYPDYTGEDPQIKNRDVIDKALVKGFKELRKAHVQDYKNLYDRVSLKLETDPLLSKLPTNERFERLKSGSKDTGYKELAFNLGRYMVISASRKGSLPANLQGVWNTYNFSPWAGNYQSNINIQEIYWSCGPLNLPECQQPYIDWIDDLSISGTEIAKEVYDSKGWISHTTGNIWGHAAPIGGIKWGMYPMGSAWHSQHVWDQYAFTRDKVYLENQAYPILKNASIFWLENLTPYKGYYITSPSVSAEHGALMTDKGLNPAFHDLKSNKYQYNIPGVFQDMEMLWDLFTNTSEAALIIGEKAFSDSLLAAREKLMPLKIGQYGQLQEWYEDIDSPDCHHRHIAHLYAAAPGRQIHPTITPVLALAAKKSLDMRGDGRFMEQEDASGGNWARAHRMWAWTRLMDGERANKIMSEMLTEEGFENGLTYQHAPYNGNGGPELYQEPDGMFCNFQLDGSGALPGCIAEMIVQSHLDEIQLLPALPTEFNSGEILGIQARGAYTVDVTWENGQLVKAIITGKTNKQPKVRLTNDLIDISKDKRITFKVRN